ncbi:hypothetical protein HanPSC8_Chr05g0212361 [Helianthus annuus]|nr:hypothetical protein HanPSC8_Chr05g0212361 [Helianthus annuus]
MRVLDRLSYYLLCFTFRSNVYAAISVLVVARGGMTLMLFDTVYASTTTQGCLILVELNLDF